MLAFSAIESSVPFLVKYTFDQVFAQQHGSTRCRWRSSACSCWRSLRGVLDFGARYLSDWVGQRVVTDLRNELTAHMQRLDLAFFNRSARGRSCRASPPTSPSCAASVTDAVASLFQDTTSLIGLIGVGVLHGLGARR